MTHAGRQRPTPMGGRLAALGFVISLLAAACGTASTSDAPVPTLGPLPTIAPSAGASASPTSTRQPLVTPSPAASATSAPSASAPASAGASPSAGQASPPASAGATASALPSQIAGPLEWTECGAPFECATLQVPLDYTNPAARSISIALVRLPSTDPSRKIGSLLTNPGGPGGSGIEYLRAAGESIFSSEIRDRFDIVSFDPRGVGESTPVECVDGPTFDRINHIDPSPDDAAEKQAIVDASKEFVAACAANSGDLLPFMTTADAARDMNEIRAAVGDDKLSYLGFSYGTFLGTIYAGLFPDRVRALALDGALDPAISSEESLIQQALGFEHALDTFLEQCSHQNTCQFNNNGQAGDAFDALMQRIDAQPLPALASGDTRTVGPGEAITGVFYALYSKSSWSLLAQGLALAQRGDGSILLLLADAYNQRQPDGSYSNQFAAFFAVNCTDSVIPTDLSYADALAAKLIPRAPRVGATFAYGSLGYVCSLWPVHAKKDYGVIQAEGAPPILVVGTTGDPATPYEWAVGLSKELASGVLLTRKGEGHTGYSDSQCIQEKVDDYLINLKTPAPNTVCDP